MRHPPDGGGSHGSVKEKTEGIEGIVQTAHKDLDSIFSAAHDELDKLAVVRQTVSSSSSPRAKSKAPAGPRSSRKTKGNSH